jgi:hypothetical protein
VADCNALSYVNAVPPTYPRDAQRAAFLCMRVPHIGENVICPSSRRSRPFSRSRFRAEEMSPNDPHGSWRPARRQHHSTHDPAGALRSAPPKPTGVDHLHKPTKPSADVLLDHVGLAAEWRRRGLHEPGRTT